jgi:hypothetical protein
MRDNGSNLRAIAGEVGITRERVRQILAANGLKTMTAEDRMERAATAWRESGQAREAADVAREHGLPVNAVTLAYLRREVKGLSLPSAKASRSQWTRAEIAACVLDVAVEHDIDPVTGWMRMSDYDHWRRDGDPSGATIGANYLWSEVMADAGFDPANAHDRGKRIGSRPKQWADSDLDRAVLTFLDAKPPSLSAHALEAFLVSHPEHPSLATIRNRFRVRGIGTIAGIITDVLGRCRTS